VSTQEERKLLLDNNRESKGNRQVLLKKLDNVVAKHFESLYQKYNDCNKKMSHSVAKWLKDGVREVSFLRIVVRASLIDLEHPFTCENVLCPSPLLTSLVLR
jgi:hypothetical protein